MDVKEFSDAVMKSRFHLEPLRRGVEGPQVWMRKEKPGAKARKRPARTVRRVTEELEDESMKEAVEEFHTWRTFEKEMYRKYALYTERLYSIDPLTMKPRKFLRRYTYTGSDSEYDSEEERKEVEYFQSGVYEVISTQFKKTCGLLKRPVPHKDLPGHKSVYTIMKENMRMDGMRHHVHRLTMIFRYNDKPGDPIQEAFELLVSTVNEDRYRERIAGTMLYYDKVGFLLVEGAEVLLLQFVMVMVESQILKRLDKCKIFTVIQHVDQKKFEGFIYQTVARPPPAEKGIPNPETCGEKAVMEMLRLLKRKLIYYWSYLEAEREENLRRQRRGGDGDTEFDDLDIGDDTPESEILKNEKFKAWCRKYQQKEKEGTSDEQENIIGWDPKELPSPKLIDFALRANFLQEFHEFASMFTSVPDIEDPDDRLIPVTELDVPYGVMKPCGREDDEARESDWTTFAPPPRDLPKRRDDARLMGQTAPSPTPSDHSIKTMAEYFEDDDYEEQ